MFLDKGRAHWLAAALAPIALAGCTVDAGGDAEGASAGLTAAQCNYFEVGGRVTICHATGSSRNPFVVVRVAEAACVNAHASHSLDHIALDGNCGPDACFPAGAPYDGTVRCCSGIDRGGVCVCPPGGYAGAMCEDINECATNNGGCDSRTTCTNTPGSRTCGACPGGYSGAGETGCHDIDECATGAHNCSPSATCANTAGGFTCTCNAGYEGSGTSCANIDDCASHPCQNGGVCHDGVGGYTCTCAGGYTGANCETSTGPGTTPGTAGASCMALREAGVTVTGPYWVNPGTGPMRVWCEMVREGGGFMLVARMADNGPMAPWNFDLQPNHSYGTYVPDISVNDNFYMNWSAFSYNEFLFSTVDQAIWLVSSSTNFTPGLFYANEQRPVLSSNLSPGPATYAWYNRSGVPEDPWVSVGDHVGQIVYGEAGWPGCGGSCAPHLVPKNTHGGLAVYVRDRVIPCAPGTTRCGTACVNLSTDVAHCGACGVACSVANGTAACTAGVCGVASCNAGYLNTGTSCVNIDDCASNPCQNGGTCHDGVSGYTCTCVGLYTGTNCEIAPSACPAGSTGFGGGCYQAFTTLPPNGDAPFNYWLWANSDCGARFSGGHLVTIGNAAENAFVRGLVSTMRGIMIAFSDAGRPANDYAWLDGSPVTYTNWSPGEPNGRAVNRFGFILTEDWGTMNPDGTWNDLPYTDGNPYVCEFAP